MPAVPAMYPSYPHSDSTGSSDTLALSRGRSWSLAISTVLLTGAALLAGCSKEQPKAPEVRPVRTLTVTSEQGAGTAEFSGDVRPRIESRLGFRVPGKIVARLVDVGATVKKGQVLARLDPADLALAQQSAQAQLSAAKTDRDLAAADLKRFSELFAKGFISAAEQQRHQANYDGAQARYEQAAAGYRNQSNQAAYATLEADADGVVTGVDAEVGQAHVLCVYMGTATMINQVDGVWHQSTVQSNTLSFAQRLFPRGIKLVRNGGPLSQLLDGLGASTVLRLDVVKDAQLVLNLPTPLQAFDHSAL